MSGAPHHDEPHHDGSRHDESWLIERVLAGDIGAFRDLVERYQRLVAHVVSGIVPAADADDVCQEVFVKVYRHLDTFRRDAKLSTWIARIARNTALHHLEKRRPDLLGDLDPDPERDPLEGLAAGDLLPDERAERSDTHACLHAALARLPVHYRTVLTLFHLGELSYDEIVAVTDLPLGTVKSYLHRARRLLKDALLAADPGLHADLQP